MTRSITLLAALAALAALALPRTATAQLSLDVHYGIARPPSADFRSAVSGARNDSHLFKNSLQIAGADAIVHLGTLELGAILDTTFRSGSASQTALGALIGYGAELGALRLEALGEVGGHRYGNFLENPDVVTASSTSEWLAYVGLRPGLSLRLSPHTRVGLWAFARWDVQNKDVPVTIADGTGTSVGSIKLGGASIGASARLGFDF
jgi:hypothetical protein